MSPKRALWFCLGMTSLGLGALGAILPLLPTVPFILLAAFAFSRSSARWHQWLLEHGTFGPMIRDWNEYGAIPKRAKVIAIISIIVVFMVSLLMGLASQILVIQAVVLTAVSVFILTRPVPPT